MSDNQHQKKHKESTATLDDIDIIRDDVELMTSGIADLMMCSPATGRALSEVDARVRPFDAHAAAAMAASATGTGDDDAAATEPTAPAAATTGIIIKKLDPSFRVPEREPGMLRLKPHVIIHESVAHKKNEIFLRANQWAIILSKAIGVVQNDPTKLEKDPDKKEKVINCILAEMEEYRATLRQEATRKGKKGRKNKPQKYPEVPPLSELFLTNAEEMAYHTRGIIRGNRGDFVGCLQDFTASLYISQYTRIQPTDNDNKEAYWVVLQYRSGIFNGLVNRQLPNPNMDQLDGDLANSAAILEIFRHYPAVVRPEQSQEHTKKLIWRTTQKKALLASSDGGATFTRPVLSAHDRRDMEVTVGRPLFHAGYIYCCSYCYKMGMRAPRKKLSLCSGCHLAWFCGRECQLAAWKRHKAKCRGRGGSVSEVLKLDPNWEEQTVKNVAENIVSPLDSVGGRVLVVARDTATGKFFDALTDEDVQFGG